MTFLVLVPSSGTPDVTVEKVESHWYPLMSPESYDKWYNTKADKVADEEYISFKEKLYGKNGGKGMIIYDNKEIPIGFIVFAALMSCSSKDVCHLKIDYDNVLQNTNKEETILGKVIGSGAHSIVFERFGLDDQVIKVSKNGSRRGFYNETKILERIKDIIAVSNGETNEGHRHVSKLVEKMILNIKRFAHEKCQVPAQVITPKGTPVFDFLQKKGFSTDVVAEIILGIFKGLQFLHQNDIAHLDVKPANIVVKKSRKGKVEAVLIDYSIALHVPSKGTEAIARTGFWGTPNYVHEQIFKYHPSGPWPKTFSKYKRFDYAGLFFTSAVLQNRGKLPWKSITDAKVEETIFTNRREVAKGLVEEITCEMECEDGTKEEFSVMKGIFTNTKNGCGDIDKY